MEIPLVRVSRLSPTIIQNGLQFIHKVMHVLELTIHRRKAYKRYLVEISQGTEDEFADQARRNFSFAIFIDGRFDVTNEQINLFRTDGAFVAGFLHSRADLFPIKGNSSAILLDHTDGRLFNLFIRRKSTLTAEAFATSTNRKVLTISRVNNFGFVVFTIGTSHRNCPEGAGSVARIALAPAQENIRDRKDCIVCDRAGDVSSHLGVRRTPNLVFGERPRRDSALMRCGLLTMHERQRHCAVVGSKF